MGLRLAGLVGGSMDRDEDTLRADIDPCLGRAGWLNMSSYKDGHWFCWLKLILSHTNDDLI